MKHREVSACIKIPDASSINKQNIQIAGRCQSRFSDLGENLYLTVKYGVKRQKYTHHRGGGYIKRRGNDPALIRRELALNKCGTGNPRSPGRKASKHTPGVNSSQTVCSAHPTFSIPVNNNASGQPHGVALMLR